MEIDAKLRRELTRKIEIELNKREVEVTENWKKELENVYRKRHESMSSLNIELKGLIERMNNRARILSSIIKEESQG